MPTVVNGIGTWYYGKQRIHRLKGTCGFCNRVGELESYDTTLYFVVFFVPLLPLARKRVLEVCRSCQKHRVIPLKQWEAAKEREIALLMEKLEQSPDDRDAVLDAIGLSVAYQDETLFNKLAPALAADRRDDAEIQAQLGWAYNYFARREEAEAAWRAALAVDDKPEYREQLALTLLKQGRPEEAAPYLEHILEHKLRDHAGSIFILVEGYQAQGLHREALALMDRRDAAFPDLAKLKEYKQQRKTSERHQDTGKRIKSAYLDESAKVGYREGNWTARIPKLVGPLVLLGLLACYLGAAVWIGQARKVYFVNGTNQAYTAVVNGQEHRLPPGATPLRVPEGEVTVEVRDAGVAPEPVRVRVESPFFSRPFVGHTFVVNPDQTALLVWEENVYAAAPPPPTPPKFYVGEPLYTFHGIDYEFEPFPATMSASKGGSVMKTRIELGPSLSPVARVGLAAVTLKPEQQLAYAKRLVRADPDNWLYLYWLVSILPEGERIEFLKPGLAVRPLRVEWHRAYQTFMERDRPGTDLRPEYRRLLEELPGNADALYLLARVEDGDAAEELHRRVAAANPPSRYALSALGYRALARGDFDEALRWMEKAAPLFTDNPHVQELYWSALRATGQDDKLLAELQIQRQLPERNWPALVEQLRVHAARKDAGKVQALIAEGVQARQGGRGRPPDAVRNELEAVCACARGDVAGFLKHAGQVPDYPPFEPALLQGKLAERRPRWTSATSARSSSTPCSAWPR
jgi:tetratricopeptide (TPR) repeat protein